MEVVGGPPKVAAECPPPPFYWTQGEGLEPPALPMGMQGEEGAAVDAAVSGEYGGVVRSLRRKLKFDPSKDYKMALTALLQRLADKALSIASHVPQIPPPPPGVSAVAQHESLAQLSEVLVELHDTLGEYRVHEARERIIGNYEAQLARLTILEASASDVVAETL